MKKIILYIVPRRYFFSEGYRGRVMHALGIAEGISYNNFKIIVVGGKGLNSFKSDLPKDVELLEIKEQSGLLNKFIWYKNIIKTIRSKEGSFNKIIIRYNISGYLFAYFITKKYPRFKKILEVNYFAHQAYFNSYKILNRVLLKVERFLVNRFDILYLVSEKSAKDPRIQNLDCETIVIPNGVTSKPIDRQSKSKVIKNQPYRLIYLGSLMYYWEWSVIINAFKSSQAKFELHFYGDGPKSEYLKSKFHNTQGVFFHGRFDRNDLGTILNPKTDILFLPPKTVMDMKNTGGLSTKAFDYLSLKLPIIIPEDGELLTVYKNKYNCLTYSRNDPKQINDAMEALIENLDLRTELAENAYNDYLQDHSWKSRMEKILQVL